MTPSQPFTLSTWKWHGGEAEAAREAFRLMPVGERAALLSFLESL